MEKKFGTSLADLLKNIVLEDDGVDKSVENYVRKENTKDDNGEEKGNQGPKTSEVS